MDNFNRKCYPLRSKWADESAWRIKRNGWAELLDHQLKR